VELPLFAAEYWLGNKLISHSETPGSWVKPTHTSVAAALGGLFALNTVTGVWNLYDSRHDTDQRALVWSHSALMLAADAGFTYAGVKLSKDAETDFNKRREHRTIALSSMAVTIVSGLAMKLYNK